MELTRVESLIIRIIHGRIGYIYILAASSHFPPYYHTLNWIYIKPEEYGTHVLKLKDALGCC